MPLDVDALRESFDLVITRSPRMTSRFYELLFERHPESRRLFTSSVRAQQEMFASALVAVIDWVEDGVWLTDTLGALGAKHVEYGVTAEMYPWVKDALLSTMAEVAAEAWTPRVEEAWSEALDVIAALMVQGAERARRDLAGASPPPSG